MGVSNHLSRSELKRQSKVSNAGGHVTLENYHKFACCKKDGDEVGHLDKDILGLEIPVGNCWLQTLALVGSEFTWFNDQW